MYKGLRRVVRRVPVDDDVARQRLGSLLRRSFQKGIDMGAGKDVKGVSGEGRAEAQAGDARGGM